MITFILTILFFLYYIGLCITIITYFICLLVTFVRTIFGKEDISSGSLPKEIRKGLRGW